MKAEQFQDAMTLLPEDLLQPVDALRRRKRVPWPSILATAACFCLLVGLSFVYGLNRSKSSSDTRATVSAENGSALGFGDAVEAPMQEQECISDSKTDAPKLFKVVAVEENCVYILGYPQLVIPGATVNRVPTALTFDNLSEVPTLEVGQLIRVYCQPEDFDSGSNTVAPYRIEIVEE